jgi:phosphoribosyl 1,2-cyclic phosphodiesterase
VEVDGEPPLIIDLGTGLRALGEYLGANGGPPVHANALLSHLHYDHVLGLPFFRPLQDPDATVDVYGPTQEAGPLAGVLAAMVTPPFFPIHLREFGGEIRFHDLDGTEDFRLGRIAVSARLIPHVGTTLGFRIEADGRSVAYLSDHQAPADRQSVDDRVLELCADADLVLHDAQYTDEEFATMSDWGHSTVGYAVHVAAEAGARRLALFHHDPSHHDDDLDRLLLHARTAAGTRLEVSAAAEGDTVTLGGPPS